MAGEAIFFVESPSIDNGICIQAIHADSDTIVDDFLLSDSSKSEFQRLLEEYEGMNVSEMCLCSCCRFLFL